MSKGRSLYMPIFQNFLKSFQLKQDNLVGKDHLGTEYYESEKGSKIRTSRWFIPNNKESFDLPTEWQSWLCHKRKNPPTEEEIEENRIKMLRTLENVKRLEASRNVNTEDIKITERHAFPVYEDYKT